MYKIRIIQYFIKKKYQKKSKKYNFIMKVVYYYTVLFSLYNINALLNNIKMFIKWLLMMYDNIITLIIVSILTIKYIIDIFIKKKYQKTSIYLTLNYFKYLFRLYNINIALNNIKMMIVSEKSV